MDLLTDFSTWKFLLVAVTIILFLLYKCHVSAFSHWKVRGVPYVEPLPLFGNLKDSLLLQVSKSEAYGQVYNKLKSKGFGGIFLMYKPALLVCDPILIKQILVKDSHCFQNRGLPFDEKNDPLLSHLMNLPGTLAKKVKVKLTPAFTSNKIKQMFPLMLECANNIHFLLDNVVDVEVKEFMARYTTDIIVSCAFGLSSNSLRDPESVFRAMGSKIFSRSLWKNFSHILRHISPKLFKFFFPRLLPKEVTEFFINFVKETIEYRQNNSVQRNDFIDHLIQLQNNGRRLRENQCLVTNEDNCDIEFTDNLLAAQAFFFFAAGFETSSNTLTFCLYELAANEEIQCKLREEIRNVLKEDGGLLTYQCIQQMEYLDKVVNETLRKYSPGNSLMRIATQDCTLASTKVQLKRGDMVIIPMFAIQRDPVYYPNPDIWDPERFTEEAKASRPPFTFIPFGEGPRHCIGNQFAYLSIKVCLVTILLKYYIRIGEKMELPLKLDKSAYITSPAGGVWLKFSKCP